jgi:hypothetical protein
VIIIAVHATENTSNVRISEVCSSRHLRGHVGRAIAQAVIRRLLTSAARVRAQVRSCGICGGQSGTGARFLRVLRFPFSILIQSTAPHSLSIIRAGTIGQLVADIPSGLSFNPPQETKLN